MKPWQQYCYLHTSKSGLPRKQPCVLCQEEGLPLPPLSTDPQSEAKWLDEQTRRMLVDFINSVNIPAFAESERRAREEKLKQALKKKCVHGAPYLLCTKCWKEDSSYDPEQYRNEISLALRRTHAEGDKEDLIQIIAMELWRASQFYGDKMNQKLAYTIAENQAKKVLKDRWEESKKVESLDIFTGETFESSPSSLSIESDPNLSPDTIILGSDVDRVQNQNTLVDTRRPQLEAYVQGLRGDSRKVGDAILNTPEASVRDIEAMTGVSKSTVDRVRKVLYSKFGDILTS